MDDGYFLQSLSRDPSDPKKVKVKEDKHFEPAAVTKGRLCLRRVGKEVLFLTAEDPAKPLEQIGDKMPFTDKPVRKVLVFVDTGGSPTVVDAVVRQIEIRAEELAGGKVQPPPPRSTWWAWLVLFLACGVLVWRWREQWRQADSKSKQPNQLKPEAETRGSIFSR